MTLTGAAKGLGGGLAAARRRPSVSVFIPCYRYGSMLEGCVASVLRQPGVDVRVLIIDDASPDGSAEVAHKLAAQSPRVEVSAHADNRGHIATYNEGLAWADGDYTVLLSADDLLTPGSLARATDLLEVRRDVTFAYGFSRYLDDGSALPERLRLGHPRWNVVPGPEWIARRCRTATNIISTPEVVVRTEAQRAAGGYSPLLPHSADLEVWLRLAGMGSVGILRGVDQALYRRHRDSMSRTTFAHSLLELQQRHEAFRHYFASDSCPVPQRNELLEDAQRALAAEALWRACRQRMRGGPSAVGVTELSDFAAATYPRAARLPEARALDVAQDGHGLPASTHPLVLGLAARHRAREWWFWRSRRWRGL